MPSNSHIAQFSQQNDKSFYLENAIKLNQQHPIVKKQNYFSANEAI
jgi:hypothetical protein